MTFLSWRDLPNPQAGGSEVLIDRLAQGCLERGHDVTLLCGGPIGSHPYRVHDLGGKFSQYLRAPSMFHREVRHADVIIDVENGIPFFSPLWSRSPVICLVHHVHGPQWRQHFGRGVATFGWSLERWAMPIAYRHRPFIAMSPSTAESLRELGIPASRIHVMINGVDSSPPATPARRLQEPLFLALGRLVPHKRIDLLLRAWERVRPEIGGRLVIAGDGPELERLRRLAGPGAKLLGAVSEADKVQLLDSAWMLIHPAMHEGWGMVVMEAAAHATPTLGFNVPGVRDAVADKETGVLVDDEDELVTQWITLARDHQRRDNLGQAALVRAHDFSWNATMDRFEAILRTTTRGTRPVDSSRATAETL